MLSWQFFSKYLFSKRSGSLIRTISRLCIAGVALGVTSFIVVMSVMNGFNSSIKKRYLAVEPHLVIYTDSTLEEFSQQFKIPPELYNKIEQTSNFIVEDIFIKTPDSFSGAIAKGLPGKNLETLLKKFNPSTYKDQYLDLNTNPIEENLFLGQGEVAVGWDLARQMGLFEGDTLSLFPPEVLLLPVGEIPEHKQVTIKRIFRSDVAEIDGRYIYYNLDFAANKFSNTASQQRGFEIRKLHPETIEPLKKAALKHFKNVESWRDRNAPLFFALRVEKLTITIFLSLAAIITSFTIITILILLVSQKKKDISILITMGLSKRKTQVMFTQIGLFLFGIGLVSGILLGCAISLIMSAFPIEILPDIYYDRTIPSVLDWGMVGVLAVIASLIGFLTAWIPARNISSLNPIEIIRQAE